MSIVMVAGGGGTAGGKGIFLLITAPIVVLYLSISFLYMFTLVATTQTHSCSVRDSMSPLLSLCEVVFLHVK
jgi:hypothetical protein